MEIISVKFTRRSFLRTYRDAPVEIRQHGREKGLCGTMRDCCRDGMQLTTEQYIAPGSPIIIRSRQHDEIIMDGVIGKGRAAKVMWCRPIADREARCFTVGVQFTPPPDERQTVRQPSTETEV